ncbi:MAG: N-formylglutamate amidohydrolase [Alphaproteobacteria bacterium]|nr:N-formylglutamate amidohydrolase [Alphaproteobacteria bacterium]
MHKSTAPGIYELSWPSSPLPLIFDSPHSGRTYPKDFHYTCQSAIIEKAEDRYVDRLFEHVTEYGATLLSALFPRSYIDVNRAEDDIDPAVISEPWPGKINPTQRSETGIGLIRRLVSPGLPVYDRPLSPAEVQARIERYYRPYHSELERLIVQAHGVFGQVWHINCHSMPSRSKVPGKFYTDRHGKLPDFVIGDRSGTSAEREFTLSVMMFLKDTGYSVSLNEPYQGVELVRRYSNPALGRHSLQIEVNRALYLDEITNELHDGFDETVVNLRKLTQFCAGYVSANLTQMAAD